MTLQAPATDARLTPEVVDFCRRHQIEPHLHRALRLAAECFQPVLDWTTEVEIDGETDDQYVIVDVYTDKAVGIDGILQRNDDFTQRWITSTPPAARDLIRVLFHLR